ncbi:probable RNA polymerase I-specific transcription initiation factor RRN3 [Zygosaccharomyces bailii]|nr:probable RNA polymerase I-specific transcription initiation factor RRN3 [Zygosaccharomyces bailii]
MMAFGEQTGKRTGQDPIGLEPKKRKVEFVVPEDGDDKEFTAEMYKRFLKTALSDLEKNETTQLDMVANQLAQPANSDQRISAENLSVLLDVLSKNINKIDSSKRAPLIQSIINFEKWWELPSYTLNKYMLFVTILCSSIPKWWQDVSMSLVSGFNLSPEKTVHHHSLLKYFLQMIPSSMGYIDMYLVRFFPNNNDSSKNLVNYISNLLTLTTYCKELQFQAWSLIVERTISLDVALQNELDELDDDIEDFEGDDDDDDNEEEEEDDTNGIPDEDIVAEDEDQDDVPESELEGEEEYNVKVSQSIKDLSTKLDAILTLVTGRLQEELTAESLQAGDGVTIFNTLTTLFKSHVLPTYYTKSIQYIVFLISQQQIELMDSFLVTLIDISFSPTETSEKKIKSLQYLGSYIARAKKLSRTQIIFVASYLTSWLNRYVLEREEEVDQPGGMERFKHFYAAFQALCYIFCFRYPLFRDADSSWECELDKFFPRMVLTKFNPLKYCNENVMLMFARIAQHEDVACCFSIIENNNNERLRGIIGRGDKESKTSQSVATSTWSLATRQQFIDLQSYFPYDPLFLKHYKQMMKDYYIEWSEAGGEYESDELED